MPSKQRAAVAKLVTGAHEDDLIRGDKGQIKACEHNAKQLLAADPAYAQLHYDEFRVRMSNGGHDWSDADDRATLCTLQAAHKVHGFTLGQVRNAVQALAYERRLDSLFKFVLELPAWDGVARIEHAFCDAWGAIESPLVRAASKNLFVALLARALKPGAQVDTIWAFEGPQGKLKSRSFRALGREFHAEIAAPIGTSDFSRELRGLWLAELSELDSFRGREASTVKRLLSAVQDRFVEKYEKHANVYPRRAVFVATTNEASYWQDSTGARRLVPIRVGEIRIDVIETNRLQWFAEAFTLYNEGSSWWDFPAEIQAEQEARQAVDPWEDLLRAAIAKGEWPEGFVLSADIMGNWLGLPAHQQGSNCGVRLGRVMRRLGFTDHRHGKTRERGWVPAEAAASGGAPAGVPPKCPPSSPSEADT